MAEVSQEARDYAADLLDIEHGKETEWSRRVRDGRYDDAPHTQAFSRFEQQILARIPTPATEGDEVEQGRD